MTLLVNRTVVTGRGQRRIYRDSHVDLWLIEWLPGQATELHDHGGSAGAFVVVRGALTEAVLEPADGLTDRLRERRRGPGEGVGFGPRHIHTLRNVSDEPAVSLHVYRRTLTRMNYYDLQAGILIRIASVAIDGPEPMPCVR
jgi:predicted metal-dependent enzyme (double-stranded beta helix superfamily)